MFVHCSSFHKIICNWSFDYQKRNILCRSYCRKIVFAWLVYYGDKENVFIRYNEMLG